MLLVAACSGIGSTAAVLLAVNSIVDQQHRVRRERLVPRAPGSAGVANWIQAQVAKVLTHALASSCCPLSHPRRWAYISPQHPDA